MTNENIERSIAIWNGKRPVCPIDGKRCNAETHKHMRMHEYSDGDDWGKCRYGPFGELGDEGYIPMNCERAKPRTTRWIDDLEDETMEAKLRHFGLHNLANKYTNTVNPKWQKKMREYAEKEDYDELRKKKKSTHPKRKVAKRCTKKTIKKVTRKLKK